MEKILVFAGSNSKKSINKQLATYAVSLLKNSEYYVLDLNDFPLPLFSVDLQKETGFPDNALEFYNHIKNCKGIVLSLAEHNGSYTAAFKNLFDWLSRIEPKTWQNKPMLLLSTSPGKRGAKSVMETALTRFPFHDAEIIESFSLPNFQEKFNHNEITDSGFSNQLKKAVEKFESFIKS